MSKIQTVTKDLGKAYRKWKDGEAEKDKLKKEFWAEIDQIASEDPEEKLIQVSPESRGESTIFEYAEREYPAWEVDEWREVDGDVIEAILLLKPEFRAFQFVNIDDGMVYQRQFAAGSPILDDDRIQIEAPDLWIDITEIPNYDVIAELVYHAGIDHNDIKDWINERWDGPRVLKPLDTLDAETLAQVQSFVHPGKPTMKLPAPRKAKPEELEGLDEPDES